MNDQMNQNPENTQDEKPDTVEQTVEKNVVEDAEPHKQQAQIATDEKQDIIDLLNGKSVTTPSETPAEIANIQDKESPAQIDAVEKEEIAGLLKDQKRPVPPVEAEISLTVQPQLDKAEKEAIVRLLRAEHEVVSGKGQTEEKETRQISKAERREILMLLGGKSAAKEAGRPAGEKVDYDSLNKQELVELLEQVVEEDNILKIKDSVTRIKLAFYKRNKEDANRERKQFIEDGGEESAFKAVEGPLEQRYNTAFNKYKHNKAKFAAELEKQKQENFRLKQQILDDLRKLIDSEETLKKTYDEFKNLQVRWKEIGMVPATELRNLWQNYHFLVECFFDKVKINKELRDLDMRKNMELKIKLCEKAEELLLEKSIVKSFKLLQQYHDEWREIGPVPSEHKEDLWERFKASTHKINQRRKEHYKELQEVQQKNYEAKVAMCEKAEEFLNELPTTLKGWNQQTDRMNELLKLWKTIGRAAKVQNDEVWQRFKTSLDGFFEARRKFLGTLKEQQMNNYNLKIDLCAQAEALKDSEDWNETTRALISLQKEWKKTGPVSRRHAEKVWKRFRLACDHFFERKKEHFKNIHVVEDDNLKVKQALVEEIRVFKVRKDKNANLDALKNFQSKWMETGHVPFKKKDEVQTQYREAIDQLIDRMDLNRQELNTSGFQSKVEMLKSAPDGNRRLSKERNFIAGRIRGIQEDLAVLENNIGFFSSSKQSNMLKQEFEKKIEKAKKEISSLKEKLKILDA
ncbi:MAG: DUF349 domain-containing protein [Bacteroidales bacterium]|nr:DUF349 domain-containing protein [Bacteroidales bacterium]